MDIAFSANIDDDYATRINNVQPSIRIWYGPNTYLISVEH